MIKRQLPHSCILSEQLFVVCATHAAVMTLMLIAVLLNPKPPCFVPEVGMSAKSLHTFSAFYGSSGTEMTVEFGMARRTAKVTRPGRFVSDVLHALAFPTL